MRDLAVDRITRLGVDDTVPVDDLLTRMWQVKANISAYDAAYVALAVTRHPAWAGRWRVRET